MALISIFLQTPNFDIFIKKRLAQGIFPDGDP